MAATGSSKFGQFRIAKENTFANLAESQNGTPTTALAGGGSLRDPVTVRGLACANPELNNVVNTATNEEIRAQAYRSALTMLDRAPEATLELYGRGEGRSTNPYDDPMFDVLDCAFATSQDISDSVDVQSWTDPTIADPDAEFVTECVVTEANAAFLTVGCGVYVKVAPQLAKSEADKLFCAFIQSKSVPVGGVVTVTLSKSIPTTHYTNLTDDANNPGNPVGFNGGRTYAQGDTLPTLYVQKVMKTYLCEAWGMCVSQLEMDFTTAQTVKHSVTMMGVWGDQHGYVGAEQFVRDLGWTENYITLLAPPNDGDLNAGDLFEVYDETGGATYIREVVETDTTTVPGFTTVHFTPPLPNFVLANLNTVPAVGFEAHGPDATPEPKGTWLAFLNGQFIGDNGSLNIKSVKFNVDNAPTRDTSPNSLAGAQCFVPGDQIVTGEMVLSGFDNARHWRRFLNSETFGIQATAQASELGEIVSVYMPSVHITGAPNPGDVDDLVTITVQFEARIYTDDSVANKSGIVSNTPFRYFVGR